MGTGVDNDKLNRERERELRHPIRRGLRDALDDGGERTPPELAAGLPDAPSLSTVTYHLSQLQRVELVARVGGVYRLT